MLTFRPARCEDAGDETAQRACGRRPRLQRRAERHSRSPAGAGDQARGARSFRAARREPRRGARGAGAPGAQPAGRAASEPRRGHRQPTPSETRRIRGAPRHRIGRSAGSRAQHHREAARRAARLRRRGAKAYDRGDRGNGQRLSIRFPQAAVGAGRQRRARPLHGAPHLPHALADPRAEGFTAGFAARLLRRRRASRDRRCARAARSRARGKAHDQPLEYSAEAAAVEEEPRPASTLAEAFA